MRSDRYRLCLLLLGAVLVTSACGEPETPETGLTGGWTTAGCEFSRTPETVTMGGRILPATPPALEAAMARIDAGGRADFPTSYAGLEVDQERVRAIVYRVPSAPFDDFIRNSAEDTCIVVRDAGHSLAELMEWNDRLVADIPAWQAHGVRISSIAARHDGVGVEIGTGDVDLARSEMSRRYGRTAPLVFVEQGPVVPLAVPGVPTAPQPGG
ncbi:hypothetical protein [Actinoplanes friuliensis]|jgi:hypothetical protein|uniref:Lipoprotein n=1 Tax=Actinoplanes friuliensis DSM 7358 TaxID=1246995 RepID=U5WAM4_9ACTN|nr:hypothetical protein [Actinoplanes friuliensis]AGZ46258.1 hypothetical protein AFR_40020 [Actinoplanes friuliensis DSM 7358]